MYLNSVAPLLDHIFHLMGDRRLCSDEFVLYAETSGLHFLATCDAASNRVEISIGPRVTSLTVYLGGAVRH